MLGVVIQSAIVTSKLSQMERPAIIILMGPPGSGKGTHAIPLSVKLHLPHISTGDLFRANMREETPLGQEAKGYIEQGKLVPDTLVLKMLFSRIQQPDCARGCILDGFPRTILQAEAFASLVGNARLTVIYLNVPDPLLIERISGRLSCKTCAQSYHTKYRPPQTPGLCDVCSAPLFQRSDDREEILIERLTVYHKETAPLIQYYAKQKDTLCEIDAALPAEQVLVLILETTHPLLLSQRALGLSS